MVPQYFKQFIFPSIPNTHKILDFGCGSGDLAFHLSLERTESSIIGIDIVESSLWENRRSERLDYLVYDPKRLFGILEDIAPDVLVSTWVLHHLTNDEQKILFSNLAKLSSKPQIIILEDAYSSELTPIHWPEVMVEFDNFSFDEKTKAIYAFDWVANILFSGRYNICMPNTYKTVEQWAALMCQYGFDLISAKYIGVPRYRDVSSPQSLMVFEESRSRF